MKYKIELILSVIALVLAIISINVVSFSPSRDVFDMNDVRSNGYAISNLEIDMNELRSYVDDEMEDFPQITQKDLMDLEDDLMKYYRDKLDKDYTGDDGEDGEDGNNWNDMSESEYNCLVMNWADYDDTMDCLNS